MKIHSTNSKNPLALAILQTFQFAEVQETVGEPRDADLILMVDPDPAELRALYRAHPSKFFAVVETRAMAGDPPRQPKNVFALDGRDLLHGPRGCPAMAPRLRDWLAAAPAEEKAHPAPTQIATLSRGYKVLVVDDSHRNLSLAMSVLVGQQILPVDSFERALQAIEGGGFEAVLTDLNLPPDKGYRAVDLGRYGVDETVPAGLSILFEATARGIPVAIVTDANHHLDWFGAMFDRVKGATVNGQRALFIQDSGKRWDRALKALVEPD
jgi:CheY-like chemotaxis protein